MTVKWSRIRDFSCLLYYCVQKLSGMALQQCVQSANDVNCRQAVPEITLGSGIGYNCSNGLRFLQHLLAASGNNFHDYGLCVLSVVFVATVVYFAKSSMVCHVGRVLCLL